jgi:hypothetical protein
MNWLSTGQTKVAKSTSLSPSSLVLRMNCLPTLPQRLGRFLQTLINCGQFIGGADWWGVTKSQSSVLSLIKKPPSAAATS